MQAIPAKMDLGDRVSRVASSATRVATTTVTDSRLRNEARIPSALEAHWLQKNLEKVGRNGFLGAETLPKKMVAGKLGPRQQLRTSRNQVRMGRG